LAADICASRESFGHRLQEKPIHRGEQRTVSADARKEKLKDAHAVSDANALLL
jgi:hypothetical protein